MPGELFPPEQWQRIKATFDRCADLPPEERAAAVAELTDDPVARKEVLALLAVHDEAGTFLETPAIGPLVPGRRLGPYQIVAHVGGGGMGDVYRAHDARLDRDVAVKIVRGRSSERARGRFQREARSIAALSHPNVLAIFDVGEDGGLPYLVTELLAGETLRARLHRRRPPIGDTLDWVVQIAHGLAAAHDRGIVHRDLKPENIFLVDGDRVKILDFGLARAPARDRRADDESFDEADLLSAPGIVVGTAGYLAPEQARGQAVGTAADLFALGAILFEALTGERAFRGADLLDTLRAVIEAEVPAPSSLRPEVPPALDRIVARCLAKEVGDRFQSAADLAFALEEAGRAAAVAAPRRRWPAALGGAAAGVAVAAAVAALAWPGAPPAAPPAADPVRAFPLTYSGRDRHPSVSPDGRFLAFTSERDGQSRIWLQQLDVGRDQPLTDGPDSAPRFSPDGSQILFTRAHAEGTSLYRVSLLGDEVRKVVDDAADGDWSPDGRQVVFLRSRIAGKRAEPVVMIAGVDGGAERELVALGERSLRGRGAEQRVRWSPDGTRIAVTGYRQHPGTPQHVLIVPVDGSGPTTLEAPNRVGLPSAVAWDGPDAIVYSQALSVTGNSAGSPAQIVRQRIDDGAVTTLLWTPEASFVVDRWRERAIVYDARSSRTNLREVAIEGGADRPLSLGTSTDRQPALSPDGTRVVFTSNRGGPDLDIWVVDRETGVSQRITDHEGEDWDPAFSPDGNHILWSSDRGGNFEVWMADADGAGARQISHDGVDAENPTMTPDGAWVIYACGAAGRAGVWKVRPDGSEATRLVADVVLPEVSPDGKHVLFQTNPDPETAIVGVATVADGTILPFEIRIDVHRPVMPLLGRARWMPDGAAIAFVGQDESGATGVYLQAFAPEGDTSATRVKLAGFDPDRLTESFDLDGERVILAETDQRTDVMAATGLPPGR